MFLTVTQPIMGETMTNGFMRKTTLAMGAAVLAVGVSGFAMAQADTFGSNSDLRLGAAPANAANTLTGVLMGVVSSNPQVLEKWDKVQVALEEVNIAEGGYYPDIDASAGVGYRSVEDDGRGAYDTQFARLELTQMLYDGGFTVNEVERLSHAALVRYYELLNTAQDVALDTVEAYLGVRRYRQLVDLARSNYYTHDKIYNQIQDRVRAGVGAEANLEQITGRLALAKSNLMTAGANLHDMIVRYQRLVDSLPPNDLTPAPPMDERVPATSADAVKRAIENNPAFHAALENINAAKARKERTLSAFLPHLDLKAHVGTGSGYDNSFGTGFESRRDEAAVALVVSMNLFNGGSDVAARNQAQDKITQGIHKRQVQCVNLRQKTLIAYNSIQEIRQQLAVLRQHKISSGQVLTAYRQQFRIGQRTLLDVLDSQNEYFEAQRAFVNAKYDLKLANARTQTAMGSLLAVTGVRSGTLPTLAEVDGTPLNYEAGAYCPALSLDGFTFEELLNGAVPEPTVEPDFVMSGDTMFAFDEYALSAGAKQHLNKVLARIRNGEVQRVFVAGYTDSAGSQDYNQRLSEKRALSVARYLVAQGVDSSRVTARGYGEADPVQSNATAAGRQANRRVAITLEDGSDV